ncbi:MAG: peptidylprolyl isomerase [Oscillospiraceae bacterium]|nr:peptidylprolyl isomerase [Oscillospiraceae bacterium]
MTKKIFNFLLVAFLVFAAITAATFIFNRDKDKTSAIDRDTVNLVQLDTISKKIADDAQVAVISTSYGEIRAELYTKYAPDTTARFIELAQQGYYDGTYVFQLEPDIYFAAGSPERDGSLADGYNKDDESIPQELSQDLWPFKGCFISCGLSKTSFFSGTHTVFGGSRFMVTDSIDFTDEIKTELYNGKEGNTAIEDAFVEYGGIPNYSQQMTIFAQTYDGMDVIDKITSQETQEDSSIPASDIIIDSVKICTYKESLDMK